MEYHLIIVGHQGIGKSTVELKYNNCIDLESSIYMNKDLPEEEMFKEYVDLILEKQKTHHVMTSAHLGVRKELLKRGIFYIFITPTVDRKEEFMKNNDNRQPHPLKTEVIDKFWNSWQEKLEGEIFIYLNKNDGYLSGVVSDDEFWEHLINIGILNEGRFKDEIKEGSFINKGDNNATNKTF